jgi:hypothetical protein
VARRRRDSLEDRIEDVVRGRERVTLEVLVELIDSVNPTGRGLSAADQRERYRLKGRLQSVLLRDHGEMVIVERVDEVTVALRLDGTGRHAAHARLDGLDDDVRSVVLRRLDTGGNRPDGADVAVLRRFPDRERKERVGPRDDAALGDAAMVAYDYEAAREHYARAADAVPSVESELRLLRLLVEVLVDDAAAIERGARVDPEILRSSAVRALLAVAEGRVGSLERATAWLDANDDPAAAAAWVELGRRQLREGDDVRARDAAGRARSLDPMVHGLDALEAELGKKTAESIAVREQELRDLIASGACEDVLLDRARSILASHPSSRAAASEKKRIEEHRARRAAAHELAEARRAAREAVNLSELETAVASLRRATRIGATEDELRAAHVRLEDARVAAEVAVLRAELQTGAPREPTLLAWLAASSRAREQLRPVVAVGPLTWLDEMGAPAGGAAAKTAVRSVLDLERAVRLVCDSKLVEALAVLDAHADLRKVARARELRAEIDARLREKSLAQLGAVRAALDEGDGNRAAALWSEIDESRFASGDATQLELTRQELDRGLRRSQLAAELAPAFDALDLSRARAVADELMRSARTDDERRVIAKDVAAHERACAERHGLVVLEDDLAALDGRDIDPCAEMASVAIDDAGKRAVVASFYEEYAFLRVVTLGAEGRPSTVIRGVAFWSVVGTLARASVAARPEYIEVSARSGYRIRLTWEGRLLEILAPPRSAVWPGMLLTTHLPQVETIWAVGMERAGDATTMSVRAIDARTGRVRRTSRGLDEYGAFTTPRGLELWGMTSRSFTRLDEDAVPFGMQHTLPSGRLLCLRPSIEDAGPYVLLAERDLDTRTPPTLRRVSPTGDLLGSIRLDSATGAIWSEIAPIAGGCFVRAVGERSMTRLIAVRHRDGKLEIAWEVDPPGVAMIVDSDHIGVWAVVLGGAIRMYPLSLDAPPTFPTGDPEPRVEVAPSADVYLRRLTPPALVSQIAGVVTGEARQADDAALSTMVDKVIAYSAVEQVWATALGLGTRAPTLAQRLFARAVELAPANEELVLEYAQHCLITQRFDEATRILSEEVRVHASTTAKALLVAARYGAGAIDDARRRSAALLDSMSERDPERPATAAFHQFLERTYGEGFEHTLAARRVRALGEALALRDAGDLRGAIERIDVAWMWRPREPTAIDILAELWGKVRPTSAHDAVRRMLALAARAAYDPDHIAALVLPGRPYVVPAIDARDPDRVAERAQ